MITLVQLETFRYISCLIQAEGCMMFFPRRISRIAEAIKRSLCLLFFFCTLKRKVFPGKNVVENEQKNVETSNCLQIRESGSIFEFLYQAIRLIFLEIIFGCFRRYESPRSL